MVIAYFWITIVSYSPLNETFAYKMFKLSIWFSIWTLVPLLILTFFISSLFSTMHYVSSFIYISFGNSSSMSSLFSNTDAGTLSSFGYTNSLLLLILLLFWSRARSWRSNNSESSTLQKSISFLEEVLVWGSGLSWTISG